MFWLVYICIMLVYKRQIADPYENIAAEEFFIKNSDEDIFMLWQNPASVIIGKHQNSYNEINYTFVRKHNIPVIRRISGGGAVYHDIGNLNFTFIQGLAKERKLRFETFTNIVTDFLGSLGIKATTNSRNSLFVNNLKVSGHAEHLYRNKVLHHGTLLFDSDLDMLNQCLTPENHFATKALPSVRSSVGNLSPLLLGIADIASFESAFFDWILHNLPDAHVANVTDTQLEAIKDLAAEKYSSWAWNFGYSPMYEWEVKFVTPHSNITMQIIVKEGVMRDVKIQSDGCNYDRIDFLQQLKGIKHNEDAILEFTNKFAAELISINVKAYEFIQKFFS